MSSKITDRIKTSYVTEVIRLVHIERSKENLQPLAENSILNQCAQIGVGYINNCWTQLFSN